MAIFIVKQLSGHKKKALFMLGMLRNRIVLSELKNKSIWSVSKNIINKSICNVNLKDLNLDLLLRINRKYPVYIFAALALITGFTLACFALAGAGSPAGKKQLAASEMGVERNGVRTEGSNSIINRGASPSEIDRFRSDRSGNQISRGWINRNDAQLLAMVIEGEAADEPMTGKVAVGAVIINRTESAKFPRNVRSVVYQPLAFESVMNGQYTRPLSHDSVRAANMAINGWDPTGGALYFWNPVTAKSKWVWQRPIAMQIGRHVFAK
jgi:N-acetylmuramoyl-L-alanine amidase